MGIKIAAVADLHLGRTSTYLPDSVNGSTKRVLKEIEKFCIEEEIDILFMAGDIVDRENKYFEAYNPLRSTLNKLSESGTSIYLVGGNHDFDTLPKILNQNDKDNIHFLGKGEEWQYELYKKGDNKLQIIGWSFPEQFYDSSPIEKLNKDIIRNDIPTIGIVHGDYYDKNSPYAPLNTPILYDCGVDAWIFGHIHKRELIEDSPIILYPGSPQALSPKEKGAHGIALLSTNGNTIEFGGFVNLSPITYQNVEIEIPFDLDEEELRSFIMEGLNNKIKNITHKVSNKTFILDLNLTGYNIDLIQIKEIKNNLLLDQDFENYNATIRKINTDQLKSTVKDMQALSHEDSMMGMMARIIKDLRTRNLDNELSQEILKEVKEEMKTLAATRTYSGLFKAGEPPMNEDSLIKFIEGEANIILSHFIEQQNREHE